MDWLIENPFADIHGQALLLAYGIIALAVIIGASLLIRAREATGWREPPPVPSEFDPCELAYFRGGKGAVIRTAVYALHRRGLVKIVPDERPALSRLVAVAASDARMLTGVERRIFESLGQPHEASSLFVGKIGDHIWNLCELYRQKLESEGLLRTAEARRAAMRILLAASVVLVALGAYMIAVAGTEERPFGVLLTILSLVALWNSVGLLAGARMTARGKAYLKRLRIAYKNMRRGELRGIGPSPQAGEPDASIAMVSLFGLGILKSTPDAVFADIFAPPRPRPLGALGW